MAYDIAWVLREYPHSHHFLDVRGRPAVVAELCSSVTAIHPSHACPFHLIPWQHRGRHLQDTTQGAQSTERRALRQL